MDTALLRFERSVKAFRRNPRQLEQEIEHRTFERIFDFELLPFIAIDEAVEAAL